MGQALCWLLGVGHRDEQAPSPLGAHRLVGELGHRQGNQPMKGNGGRLWGWDKGHPQGAVTQANKESRLQREVRSVGGIRAGIPEKVSRKAEKEAGLWRARHRQGSAKPSKCKDPKEARSWREGAEVQREATGDQVGEPVGTGRGALLNRKPGSSHWRVSCREVT